jgi:O-antigen/teichoic acid export membrane protein
MRTRRLIINVLATGGARGVNLLITLAMVPLTLNALSAVDYGYYAMALSLSIFAAYADLGMGLAIVNAVAQLSARPAARKANHLVSVTWFSLLAIAAGGLLLLLLAALVMAVIYGADARREAMLLAVGCVLAGLPSGLVQRLLFARERNVQANLWATGARVSALVAVFLLVQSDAATLASLVMATVGIPTAIGWLSILVVFRQPALASLRPQRADFRRQLLAPALAMGLSFVILQLVPFIEIGVDALLVGRLIGIESVAAYDVNAKLFAYIPALISIAAFPLWPAVANAIAAADLAWVARIKSFGYTAIALLAGATSVLMAIYADAIIQLWIGRSLPLGMANTLMLAILSVLFSLALFQSMILNGSGVIRRQIRFCIVYVPILLLVKVLAAAAGGLLALLSVTVIAAAVRLAVLGRLAGAAFPFSEAYVGKLASRVRSDG